MQVPAAFQASGVLRMAQVATGWPMGAPDTPGGGGDEPCARRGRGPTERASTRRQPVAPLRAKTPFRAAGIARPVSTTNPEERVAEPPQTRWAATLSQG